MCAALVLAALAVHPVKAEAYDNDRGPNAVAYVSCKGSNPRGYYCNSYEDMFNCTADMLSGTHNPYQVDTVTIDVLCDWNTKDYGHLVFDDDDCTYFLNLHGHMIDRGLTTADTKFCGTGNGDVIRIKGETKVIIDGGTTEELAAEHYGKLVDDGEGGKFWKYDANADKNDKSTLAITGGLITGGADDDSGYGGGISVGGDDAGLSMTNVTVAGNVTDNYGAWTPQGTGTRYGAGIHNRGAASLTGCKVIYNHSESDGGGIYCDEMGDESITTLENTEVSYNTSRNDGGGICAESGASIVSMTNCKVSHNISARYGGGMYIYTRGTGTLVLGANTQVCDNVSLGVNTDSEGGGGGICFHQDAGEASGLTAIVEDGVNISRNSVQDGHAGGGILFDMPIHSSSHFIVKGTWTVSENKAASGGGIAQRTDLTQNFNFGNIVLTNNEATGSGGGIYKRGGGTDTFGSGAVLKGNKAGANGGFLCVNYGKGTVAFPDGGLTIEDNTADYNGGAIAASTSGYLTLSCSTGGMKFINNRAGRNGGAIYASHNENSDPNVTPEYCGTKLDIFGDTTTEFANNTAGDRGGAIMFSCETERTTHISNATFTGNAAGKGGTEGYGGAIFFRNELYLKNASITGNTATKGGGGIYSYNTDYYNFEFAGKMTVTDNNKVTYEDDGTTTSIASNNLEMKGEQDVCSAATEADAVTPESKIGVTISDYSSGKRRLTGNSAFVTLGVKDSWKGCMISDNPQYEVVRDGDYLYLAQGSTESELRAYGADESTPQTTGTYKAGAEVELKSSDYPKSTTSNGQTYNWALDYWTVSCEATGSSKVVKPDENGVATITMGSDTTVARAHYTAPLTYLFLGVSDSDSWDNLTTKSGDAAMAAAYAHYAQFDDADGKRSTFTFDQEQTPFTVVGRSVTDNADSDGSGYVVSKSITYTISMPVSAATEKGLVVDRDALKKFALEATFSGMDGSKESGEGSLSVNNDDTVTFTCTVTKTNPTKKSCTITFDANGGKLDAADATRIVSANDKVGELPTPTLEGHTFVGWFIKDADVKVTKDTAVVSNLELVAKWSEDDKPIEYVTVTCKDGDADLGSFEIEKGSALVDPVHPTKTGYTFKGWKRSASATECVTFPLENVTENLTLYADWKIDTCKVTFDLAGGTLDGKTTVDAKTVNYGDKLSDPGTPTKDGFDFVGWYNGVDKYEFGESVTSDLSLIAVWKEKAVSSFEVSFDLNGADGDAPATQPVNDGGYATTPDDPTWKGHVFKGWYTDKACSDDNKFNFATTPIDANIKLYAKWKKTYTVTFVFNNGTDEKETRIVEEGAKLSDLPRVTYADYIFTGWFDSDKNEFKEGDKLTSDLTLQAYWDHEALHVRFWDDEFEIEGYSKKVIYGASVTKPDDPKKTGYTFEGWYSNAELTEPYRFSGQAITADTDIYSKWTVKSYTVTFDAGEGSKVDSQKVEYGSRAKEPTAPTRKGYDFTGWYKDKECTEEFSFAGTPVEDDLKLYAGWKIKSFTVTFDAGEGSKVDSQKVEYGSRAKEPTAPTRKGYDFTGWYKDKECTEEFSFAGTPVEDDLKLYAGWKIKSFTVTFDTGEGSKVDSQKVEYGSCAKEPAVPTRKGYTFEGWTLDGNAYDFKTPVAGELKLVALWKEKKSDPSDGDKKDDKKDDVTPDGDDKKDDADDKGDDTSDDDKGDTDDSPKTVVIETKTVTTTAKTTDGNGLASTGDNVVLVVGTVLAVGMLAVIAGALARRRS